MRFTTGLCLFCLLVGCRQSGQKTNPYEMGTVEVEPGFFASIGLRSAGSDNAGAPTLFDHAFPPKGSFTDFTELQVEWNGAKVHWEGNSHPVNLRAFEGKLYLIAFDRTSKGHHHAMFKYFTQDGARFREIPPAAFPRAIAGQNMGFFYRDFMCGNEKADMIQLARGMNPSAPCFDSTLTAYIWNHLATGQDYFESEKIVISDAVLRDYVRTNNPIRLTAIVRDEIEQSPAETNSPPRK
jgi:hypothetical protein